MTRVSGGLQGDQHRRILFRQCRSLGVKRGAPRINTISFWCVSKELTSTDKILYRDLISVGILLFMEQNPFLKRVYPRVGNIPHFRGRTVTPLSNTLCVVTYRNPYTVWEIVTDSFLSKGRYTCDARGCMVSELRTSGD